MNQLGEIPLGQITPELLARYDRQGPRYTSYPTAVDFDESFTSAHTKKRLISANTRSNEPLSLYVHIPFCERRCSFCGCNVIITKRRDVVDKYIEYLSKELDLLASLLTERKTIVQYHWGGGTPTYLDFDQMQALASKVAEHFVIAEDAEVALEVDPDVTTIEQLFFARKLGFNRLSIGVQDLSSVVLRSVNRALDENKTRILIAAARKLGFKSVNIDLIYGLPFQTPKSFAKTIEKIVAMRPSRIAVYSFAYVPWIKKHQKKLPAEHLPGRETKFALFAEAIEGLLSAGYLQIGMDHFALPEDEMGRAVTKGTLFRNFMGYTVHRAPDMLGIGVSSISSIRGTFVQNHKKTAPYYHALDQGSLPTERGYTLDFDDVVRQRLITEIMCNFKVKYEALEADLGFSFADYFADEIRELQRSDGQLEQGLVEIGPEGLLVTPLGRLFVRNICMVFDRHLRERKKEKQLFSRTV